jgi:hypothetical protein
MTSRELVQRTLEFQQTKRVPRQLWSLPIAQLTYVDEVDELMRRFPDDISQMVYQMPAEANIKGDRYSVGEYRDEWGCVFENVQAGVIGQVKHPILDDWSKLAHYEPPFHLLGRGMEDINRSVADSDKFVLSDFIARPFERMQFLRGSQNLYMDIAERSREFFVLRDMVHDYYCRVTEEWAKTDVDGIFFMDDWGAQKSLLISPDAWRELLKPLYADYCRIAHDAGKYVFMHSDGFIFDIYEDLIEIGADAINSQLFIMDIEEIGRKYKGRLTFWGEIDRQHILPSPDVEIARQAVRRVADALYDGNGGVIAQFELGAAARIENAYAIFEEWEKIAGEQ